MKRYVMTMAAVVVGLNSAVLVRAAPMPVHTNGAPVGVQAAKDSTKQGGGDSANLLQNPSFETPLIADIESTNVWDRLPDAWDIFNSNTPTVTLAAGTAHQGAQGVKLSAQGKRNGDVGLFQVVTVEPGSGYQFSLNVMNDDAEPIKGSAYGELTLEWQDAAGDEISRERSKSWGPALPKNDWKKMIVKGKAPANAAAARIVVTLFDGPNPAKGAFWVDDADFSKE